MANADLVVIGAGPAGMAAARVAAASGLSVVLLDEQMGAGGQIYRDVERSAKARGAILGTDYFSGTRLVEGLRDANIRHIRGAVAWQIEDRTRVAYSTNGRSSLVRGTRLLIATGALERPMPVPGWTLPGVMTAGAAQILLKQSGMVLGDAVLAGSGPLLYLIAAQMIRAGTPPLALVETQTMANSLAGLRHGLGAVRGWRYLVKGLGLLAEIRKARIQRYRAATNIAIEGKRRANAITFSVAGRDHRLDCSTVLLHHGVVPNTQAARSIGVPHRWHPLQRAFLPETDKWGRTPLEDVFIAGDGGGIGGAAAAAIAGEIAAHGIACDLGKISTSELDRAAAPLFGKLKRELSARPFLDAAFPPYAKALAPDDETIVCRCEEVTARDIRHYAALGCIGPNQAKAFGRPGMGPCQGRYCGLTVSEILAAANGQTLDETGYYKIRPPLKPVTVAEIASLKPTSSAQAEKEPAK